jgi:tripartite-type tricarboxylate transporter receptor subunit TctC
MAGAPNIPTAIESGMPDLKFDGWFSLFAPKATPEPIISQLGQATRKVMSNTSLLENIELGC